MRKRALLMPLVLCGMLVSAVTAEEFRTWRTGNGQRTKVKLAALEVTSGSVRFKRQDDGREFTFPMSRLSSEDQQALREQFALTAAEEVFEGNPANQVHRVRWDAPELDDQNLDQWADYLWPTEQDLVWRKIRWHNNLGEAAAEAKRLNRPILLWTMNGNPCGET